MLITGADGYLGGCVRELLPEARCVGTREDWPYDELVIHLGWRSKAGDSEPEAQKECLARTLRLAQTGAKIVFASTASVYGDVETTCKEDTHCDPKCAYSRAKLAAEYAIRFYSPASCILRFGSLMGVGATRTKPDVIVNAFCLGPIECWNPKCWKPLIHVRDAAEAVREAVRWSGVYNVSTAQMRAGFLADRIAKTRGCEWKEVEDRNGRRSTLLSSEKFRKAMPEGWEPRSLESTIQELLAYIPRASDPTRPW